eukprot:TRINITY_DN2826_c0_g5_i1.p1 TRINITY_DN2826_c0_g5~~TRINITY_DN2826_c0_g5_i1.p1  ORF type:complete len:376 (-),score=70.43 TRINITY_DN2826_c0_g5_i1:130-1155(-)
MGTTDSSPANTNDTPSNSFPAKSLTPIEVSADLAKKISKRCKRHKRRSKPLLHYKPLFSWEPEAVTNEEFCKEGRKYQPKSSFKAKEARDFLPAATPMTPQTGLNRILQQTDNDSMITSTNRVSKIGLQQLSSQIIFAENCRPQNNFELLASNASKSPLRQDMSKGVRLQCQDVRTKRRASVIGKDLIHTRVQSKPHSEISPPVTRRPTINNNLNRQRRSSLLKDENLISSIAKLSGVTEGDKELPRIKRMNAFKDKEETKQDDPTEPNEEATPNSDNIALVLREQYNAKKKEEEKKKKVMMKPVGEVTSKAEKRRLWVGGNGRFDPARLKFWYNKMGNVF